MDTKTKSGKVPVNVIFPIGWQIIIDNQGNLLDIDTTSK